MICARHHHCVCIRPGWVEHDHRNACCDKATSDAEIMAAVSKLVDALAKERAAGASNVHIQATMSGGVAGVLGAQNVSVGSMNIGGTRPDQKG